MNAPVWRANVIDLEQFKCQTLHMFVPRMKPLFLHIGMILTSWQRHGTECQILEPSQETLLQFHPTCCSSTTRQQQFPIFLNDCIMTFFVGLKELNSGVGGDPWYSQEGYAQNNARYVLHYYRIIPYISCIFAESCLQFLKL